MSSSAIKKYLTKILLEYEKSTDTERTSQQKRAQHAISTDMSKLKVEIDRAQAAFNIPREVTDDLYEQVKSNIDVLSERNGKLTFNEILAARQSAGVSGKALSKGNNEYSVIYLKDPRTGEAYEDPNGVKIQLKDIIQADHDEGISTIQTKATLKKLLRYRDSYIKNISGPPTKNQSEDIKLLNMSINIFNKTLSLQEKIDNLGNLDEELGDILNKSGVSKEALSKFMKGDAALNISIDAEPSITIEKIVNHKTKSISFVLSSDNGLAGTLSKTAKQAGANALGFLLFNSLQSDERSAAKNLASRGRVANRYEPIYNISSAVTKVVYSDPKVFAGLKGSPSYLDYIESDIVETLSGGKIKKEKPATSKNTIKGKKESVKINIPKLEKIKVPTISKAKIPRLRNLDGKFTSLTSLQNLLNTQLHDQIKKNMHRPNLNYQTGRFAESVKVEQLSRARDGAITAFMSYMRYPYATFEVGGKQGHKGYYPSRLINTSVRELAAKLVKEKFTSITIK